MIEFCLSSLKLLLDRFSPGSLIIVALAMFSSLLIVLQDSQTPSSLEMWLFAKAHQTAYEPIVEMWNQSHEEQVDLHVLGLAAMERRMLSGFLSGTPVADLIEADVNVASRAFAGPLSEVGFLDLTDRLHDEGLYDQINAPSFSPWTSRGRIFGIPHDVHPVLLCYRADIVEAAGIDVAQIETWNDFVRLLRPLMKDQDGDGRPDRYLLNIWEQQLDVIEALILQAGGSYFDRQEQVQIVSDINVHVVSTITSWMVNGPNRIAIDAEEFSESGNRLRVQGKVVASLMPDWLTGVWKRDLQQLHGKVKLMPLPAWSKSGNRTSVWGGSMLGISKRSSSVDQAWDLAQELYLSKSAARQLYATNGIISPVKRFWNEPFYSEPDSYFCNQRIGNMYISMAPHVPIRTSSPHNKLAKVCVRNAISALRRYAEENRRYEPEELYDEARRQLQRAEDIVQRQIDRNTFLQERQQEEGR